LILVSSYSFFFCEGHTHTPLNPRCIISTFRMIRRISSFFLSFFFGKRRTSLEREEGHFPPALLWLYFFMVFIGGIVSCHFFILFQFFPFLFPFFPFFLYHTCAVCLSPCAKKGISFLLV
jgi:hypothetical protein